MAKLERTDKPVSVLLEDLEKGILGLPEIQRSYVWTRPKARDLIDSLYHEYPSGVILLWKPQELPVLREATIELRTDRAPDFLILDGQQRLTSLEKVFNGEIDVYFNVENQEFQIYSRKLKTNPFWISVKEVINDGAINVWRKLKKQLDSRPERTEDSKIDEYLDRLYCLGKIKGYRYPVMIIHTDDYEEITESFIRVNSKGTRLRWAELAMARLALHWPGALVKEFDEALDDYERANYDLEARFLMRCFVAVGTNQCRFRHLASLWEKGQNELKDIWRKTKKGTDHTINFLKNNAGIESSDWVPSINALVPLVVYLSKKQGPLTDDEAKGLLFWFFEATIHRRFAGSPETKINRDLKTIETPDPVGNLIGNFRQDISNFEITPEMIEGKYTRHPFMPLLFAICRNNNARDWFTGVELSSTNVGPEHHLELHHIFPRAILKQTDEYTTQEIDDFANMALLSQKANRTILKSKPEDYLPKIEEERLRAQFVPLESGLWKVESFRDFIGKRRELLIGAMSDYLRSLGPNYLQGA